MSDQMEECYECGEHTGRAGASDDSLYCENCNRGPYCSDCFTEHGERQAVIDIAPGKNIPGLRCEEDR